MSDLARDPGPEGTALATDQHELEAMESFQAASRAPSTLAAYENDFAGFALWCTLRGFRALPADPATVARHLAAVATGWRPPPKLPPKEGDTVRTLRPLTPASISRLVAAINWAHKNVGLDSPTQHPQVKAQLCGIRRSYVGSSNRKAAAVTTIVRRMLDTCGTDTVGVRDRALLALGFAGAFRRSELVALNVEDLTEVPDGYRIAIRRSKTNQAGEPEVIPIGRGTILRPVEAVQTWLQTAGIESGPIFLQVHKAGAVQRLRARKGVLSSTRLSPPMVAVVVKKRARAAGFSEEEIAPLSGHSLRAGFITSAAENGASIFKIMDVSRHKSMDTMRGYVRNREMFKDYAGAGIL
jgi:integrase